MNTGQNLGLRVNINGLNNMKKNIQYTIIFKNGKQLLVSEKMINDIMKNLNKADLQYWSNESGEISIVIRVSDISFIR